MKYFKFILINVIAFGMLFFLFSLLFPSQVVTSATVSVAATKNVVTKKINNTSDWPIWNALAKNGIINNNTRPGSDTMLYIIENNNRKVEANFIIYQEQTNSVLVNWAVVEKLPWYKPWKKFRAMILSKNMAAVMDTSLNNLKTQIEAGK